MYFVSEGLTHVSHELGLSWIFFYMRVFPVRETSASLDGTLKSYSWHIHFIDANHCLSF